jgi:TonB family protein
MSQLIRHRFKQKTRLGLLAGAAGLEPLAASAGTAPSLVLRDPDSSKSSVISGSITTFLHVAAFGVLLLLAWLAPPVEQLIEVRIIRELPGSNAEPAPARKVLKSRARRTPIAAAQRVSAQAVAQPRVLNLSAEQLRLNELRKATAPQTVQRRQVVSQRTEVRSIDTRVHASKVDLSKLTTVTAPTDLVAPVIDLDGPRKIDPGAAVKQPENFAVVPDVKPVEYTSGAPFQILTEEMPSGDVQQFDFDTDIGAFAGGEGTGGTGSAEGTVRCMESAFVLRYLDGVRIRTQQRWQVPAGVPQDATVRVKFMLDASGTATRVEFVGDTDPLLGTSAVEALRAASPFPPMDDNVRCLAGQRLSGRFTVQNL